MPSSNPSPPPQCGEDPPGPQAPSYDLSTFVPLECPAGTLVLLHGENVHYSAENTSDASRHSYSMHVVESAPGVAWSPDNWAQRPPDMPWEPLYEAA
jgi:phytanoyl-CoA hydroxylase